MTDHAQFAADGSAEPELTRNALEPKGCHPEEPEVVPLSWARRCSSLLLPSSARTARRRPRNRLRHGIATSADCAGQHGQQCAGLEEPACRRAAEAMQQAEHAADPALAEATPAQQAAAAGYGPNGQAAPCVPGQPCSQPNMATAAGSGQPQLSPAAASRRSNSLPKSANALQLAIRIKSRLYPPAGRTDVTSSSRSRHQPRQAITCREPMTGCEHRQASSLIAPRAAGEQPHRADGQASIKHGPEVNIDSAVRPALRHL